MKYLCLVYQEPDKLGALSDRELDTLVADCMAWVQDLEDSARHVFSAGLQSARTASTVRIREGKLSVTDGPYTETKELLGGFTLLDARDLNEAIHLASKLPAARLGSIEVRPILAPDLPLIDPLDRRVGAAIDRHTPKLAADTAARMTSIATRGAA